MDIFDNEHEVLTVGDLTIENRFGSVVIYGDLEIMPDDLGRKQAMVLSNFFDKLAKATHNSGFDNITLTTEANEMIKNPFD